MNKLLCKLAERGALRASQFRVLFRGQHQEYAAAAGGDGLLQHQPALLIGDPTASFHELDHLVRRLEVQFAGQGGLQILLQKLAMPAITLLERHVCRLSTVAHSELTREAIRG